MVEVEDNKKSEDKAEANNPDYNTTKLKKTLTNSEILAQSVLFLIAGSESTATNLTWLSYKLAMHPDIQDKLIEEIDSVLEKHVKYLKF